MKNKKIILTVWVIVCVIALCVLVAFGWGDRLSGQKLSVSIGRLYFTDFGTYIIDDNDMAMLVTDCSKDGKLFEGYKNGDTVSIYHDGVEESYPARTGGYSISLISKGDGTYKPADEVLGYQIIEETKEAEPIDFEAQYIRTDGYDEDEKYPVITVLKSVREIKSYYDVTKDKYDLERKEKVYADTTIGFLDACDKYNDEFFNAKALVLILVNESSGSIRHKVDSVSSLGDTMCVQIDSISPEWCSDDMAQWHIVLEVDKDAVPTLTDNLKVYMDGELIA